MTRRTGLIRVIFPPEAGPDPFAVCPSLTPTMGAVARSTKDNTLVENGALDDDDLDPALAVLMSLIDAVARSMSGVTLPEIGVVSLEPDDDVVTTVVDSGLAAVPDACPDRALTLPINLPRSSAPVRGAFQSAAAAPITPPRTDPTTNAALCR